MTNSRRKILLSALLFLLILPPFAGANIRDGLVAWWKLDEASGTTGYDSSGNGNNADFTGHAASFIQGVRSRAYAFNGTSQYGLLNNGSALMVNTSITMALWIYPTNASPGVHCGIVGVRNADNHPGFYMLQLGGGTSVEMRFRNSAGSATTLTVATTAKKWQHVALVYNGSTLYAYLNGSLSTSGAATGAITDGTYPFEIARNTMGVASYTYFPGYIDDVRLYNRALSATEIGQLYAQGASINNAVIRNAGINQ